MKRALLLFIIVFTVFILNNRKSILTNLKMLYLISQEVPQLKLVSFGILPKPTHLVKIINSSKGKIVIDLFIPKPILNEDPPDSQKTLIATVGVRLTEQDKYNFLNSAERLSKLGYIVVFPRSEAIHQNHDIIEDPQTYVEAFRYVSGLDNVDKNRISFLGFSTGASIAFIAAADPAINRKLHSIVFFAGYFNIYDYIRSLVKKSFYYQGKNIAWQPKKEVFTAFKRISKTTDAQNISALELDELTKINPKDYIKGFKAPIFIIHDLNDRSVPYVEAIKLYQALDGKVNKFFILTNIFDHVRPRKNISLNLKDGLKYYRFFYNVLNYL